MKTALLALAISISFTGIAAAQDATTVQPAATTAQDASAAATTTTSVEPATATATAAGSTSKMTEQDVRASLTAQGYTNIHDLELEDGIWEAEAKNSSGKEVELKLDPTDGHVLTAELGDDEDTEEHHSDDADSVEEHHSEDTEEHHTEEHK